MLDENQKNIIQLFKSGEFELSEMIAISNGYGKWFSDYINNFCDSFLKEINFDFKKCIGIFYFNKHTGCYYSYKINKYFLARFVLLKMFIEKIPFNLILDVGGSGYLYIDYINLAWRNIKIEYKSFLRCINPNNIDFCTIATKYGFIYTKTI
jgi:hypothetical protein